MTEQEPLRALLVFHDMSKEELYGAILRTKSLDYAVDVRRDLASALPLVHAPSPEYALYLVETNLEHPKTARIENMVTLYDAVQEHIATRRACFLTVSSTPEARVAAEARDIYAFDPMQLTPKALIAFTEGLRHVRAQ